MSEFTPDEQQRIQASILEKYGKVARAPEGQFRYPTGQEGLEKLGYPASLTERLPREVREFFVGVGNPFSLGAPLSGQRVLDVGCGAGVDTLLAALATGPGGEAVGIELSPEMLARALENQRLSGISNAGFLEGSAEALPVEDESFDVAISNGVFNLVVDKRKALAEVFRSLAKGGRFQIADQILTGKAPGDHDARIRSWFT